MSGPSKGPTLQAQQFTGRGALSNPAGRFDATLTEQVDDGWHHEEEERSIATVVLPEPARSIITRNDSPDVGFEQSINPYRGCEHGCIYCYARPSHAYLGLSPGLDFETRLFYKADAARLLAAELARNSYVCKPIMLGANTDPYQPVERRLRVTRSILEELARWQHPVCVITKAVLVQRDTDLLAALAAQRLTQVTISLTSLDPAIKRTLEPRAAAPMARLAVVRKLSAAGIPVGVLIAPVIPAITDHELESLLEAAAQAGAVSAGYVLLRLPRELHALFEEWLAAHHPGKQAHVMSLLRQMRGGRANDPAFGTRMSGTGAYAQLLRQRFERACRRYGLDYGHRREGRGLDCTQFRNPDGTVARTTPREPAERQLGLDL